MLITVWWLRNRKKNKNLLPQFLLLLLDVRLGDCLLPLLPGKKHITLTNYSIKAGKFKLYFSVI